MRIYGKTSALGQLKRYSFSGRMPHALLITGEEGVGKRTLADYAAMLMLCEKKGTEPCMVCNECLRIEQHIHPDVVYPLRETKNGKYNAADMVEFINGCIKLPNDADMRICIFEEADGMNISCQNALLKFIEEPLPFNRFIFTASDKSRILETIISRVTEIKAEPSDKNECLRALADNGIFGEEAEKLFRTFGGNIGRCICARSDESALSLFKLAEEIAFSVAEKHEYNCMSKLSGIKNRDELSTVIKNVSDIFGNAAVISAGGKPYGFYSSVCGEMAERLPLRKISKLYDASVRLLSGMEFNPNTALAAAECCARFFTAIE